MDVFKVRLRTVKQLEEAIAFFEKVKTAIPTAEQYEFQRHLQNLQRIAKDEKCLNCPIWNLENEREIKDCLGILISGEHELLERFSPDIIKAAEELEEELNL